MKVIALLSLLGVVCPSLLTSATVAAPAVRNVWSGGWQRTYFVHAPVRVRSTAAPLVIVLHGLGGTGLGVLKQTGWIEKADQEGFLVVAPEGLPEHPERAARFLGNRRSWNAGPESGSPAAERGTDDVAFIEAVIAEVERAHRVEEGRIYVTGFSNGAAMAFRVGAELSQRVTAIAPVGNALLIPVGSLSFPVSLMLVWGVDDPVNPIQGGAVTRGGSQVVRPSAESSWLRWAALLACPDEVSLDQVNSRVTRRSRVSCGGGSRAILVEIKGLGHQWPGGRVVLPLISGPGSDAFNATDEIWRFFNAHHR